jgi:hypothetical protein
MFSQRLLRATKSEDLRSPTRHELPSASCQPRAVNTSAVLEEVFCVQDMAHEFRGDIRVL